MDLNRILLSDTFWMIGGNLNLSETFDEWSGDSRGSSVYFDLMKFLGLVERSRFFQSELTITFK